MGTVLLTPAYLAPVQYYAKLYAFGSVLEERCGHYVKQTYRNRCVIAGPGGPQALIVPVEHTGGRKVPLRDVRVSDHGDWRRLHWTALVTAYEGSPFFEYYADDLRPFYERRYVFLVDLDEALQAAVLELLGLSPRIAVTERYAEAGEADADLRESISPKADFRADAGFRPMPYYQVFSARHGFLPNLSIADLLFNMGPEARMVLRDSCR